MSKDSSQAIQCELRPAGETSGRPSVSVRAGLYVVQVVLERPVRAGADVDLTLTVPDGQEPILCKGAVVWQRKRQTASEFRHGVAMIDASPAARTRLGRYLPKDLRTRHALFREFALFEPFTDGQLQVLLELCFSVSLHQGSPFYHQGVSGDQLSGLFIVEKGMVRIYHKGVKGQEETLWTANAGQLFGEMSLFTGEAHSASIQAVNDSRLVGLTSEAFRFLQTHYAPIAMQIMEAIIRTLCNRLGRTTKMLFSPTQIR